MNVPEAEPSATAKPPRRRTRRGWWWLVGLVILLGAAAGAGWYWRSSQKAAAKAKAAKNTIAQVTRGAVEKSVESSGSVSPNLEVAIKCRASGEIVKLPFDISDHVKKGDLLCQLDPTDEQLAVQSSQAALDQATAKLAQAKVALESAKLNLVTSRMEAQAQLASAKVSAQTAQATYRRQQQLADQKLGSQADLEAAHADAASAQYALSQAQVAVAELKQQEVDLQSKEEDVKLAQAQVDSQKIELSIEKKQLDYTTVKSPMDGVVSDLSVQKGSIVASGISNVSGGTTIMTLMDLSKMYVLATVDESDIGGVKVGQDARITVDSFPNRTFKGKVVRVAVQGVNTSNVVTFNVKVEVTDKDKNLLKPEMTGNVTIIEQRHDHALLVPAGAVSRRGDKYFVTTADHKSHEVSVGIQGLDDTEITKGVNEGDRVLVNAKGPVSRWTSTRRRHGPRL